MEDILMDTSTASHDDSCTGMSSLVPSTKLAKIINDIKEANTKSKRVYAIGAAIEEFDHTNFLKHNEEIQAGALNALYHQLLHQVLLIHDTATTATHHPHDHQQQRQDNTTNASSSKATMDYEIIADICFTCTYLLRCSPQMKISLFSEENTTTTSSNTNTNTNTIGFDLIKVFLQIIQCCFESSNSTTSSRIIYYPMKVIQSLSRIDVISHKLANWNELLSTILLVLGGESSTSFVDTIHGKLETMQLLKNMVHHAPTEESKLGMVRYPSLVSTLVQNIYACCDVVGTTTNSDGNDYCYYNSHKLKEMISCIMLSFTSSSPTCRNYIIHYGIVLNAFIQLLHTTSTTTNTTYMTRYNTLSSILCFAHDEKCIALLLSHCDGVFMDVISHIIQDTTCNTSSEEEDQERTVTIVSLRMKALEICRALSTKDTIELLLERHGFLHTLEDTILRDRNHTIRLEVAKTFICFVAYVTPTMHVSASFIQLLVRLSDSSSITTSGRIHEEEICIHTSARAILKMTLVANNHGILTQTSGLLTSLATIALSSNTINSSTRENATGALFNLSCSTIIQTREYMLSNTHLLYALVKIASFLQIENKNARDFAVGTLVNLSYIPAARSKLVKFDGLLVSLIQFVADTSVERFAKESVKSSIIQLVAVI